MGNVRAGVLFWGEGGGGGGERRVINNVSNNIL